jgi:DNA-binding protein HU-beta
VKPRSELELASSARLLPQLVRVKMQHSPCFHWVLSLSTLNSNLAKALTKSQIVASFAKTVGLTKNQAVQTSKDLIALAYKDAKHSFTIPGLGKIVLVNRKARMGRNPATGETIKIAAKRVVKFRVSKAAKDAILGSKKTISVFLRRRRIQFLRLFLCHHYPFGDLWIRRLLHPQLT